METWINIVDHREETIDPIVATIDYSAPTTANISGGQKYGCTKIFLIFFERKKKTI